MKRPSKTTLKYCRPTMRDNDEFKCCYSLINQKKILR